MGSQPESEDQCLSNDELNLKDAPIDATLDLTLDFQDEFIVEIDEEETPLSMCQICMEFYGSKEVQRNICGPACLAEVCSSCLVQHLSATVYSFYVGVLPKMRCPVCLVLLNKAQWKKFVTPPPAPVNNEAATATNEPDDVAVDEEESAESEADDAVPEPTPPATNSSQQNDTDAWLLDNSHIVQKYEVLCRQSCGFQSPCCHNTDYSMLKKTNDNNANAYVTLTLPRSQAELLPQLSLVYREYCLHRVEVADLYAFIIDHFGDYTESVVDALVENTVDEERRANLLLLDLFHNPNTYTHCCDRAVCFKCKSAVHHDGNCGDFVVDENLLDCPGCRVTLVKVDGCDSVTCLCGTSIEWPQEMAKQRTQRKQLAPSDNQVYKQWKPWFNRLKRCLHEMSNLEATRRQQRLDRMLHTHRIQLKRLVDSAVRRAKLNLLIREHGERLRPLVLAHLERRKASISKHESELTMKDEEPSACIAPAA